MREAPSRSPFWSAWIFSVICLRSMSLTSELASIASFFASIFASTIGCAASRFRHSIRSAMLSDWIRFAHFRCRGVITSFPTVGSFEPALARAERCVSPPSESTSELADAVRGKGESSSSSFFCTAAPSAAFLSARFFLNSSNSCCPLSCSSLCVISSLSFVMASNCFARTSTRACSLSLFARSRDSCCSTSASFSDVSANCFPSSVRVLATVRTSSSRSSLSEDTSNLSSRVLRLITSYSFFRKRFRMPLRSRKSGYASIRVRGWNCWTQRTQVSMSSSAPSSKGISPSNGGTWRKSQ
mmetsp:Transcript_59246/g.139577  ORF Transcript_59246/g.139577 Transcript_59246/m.139577 type:complete len:299 (+) Transcript_59246:386-1282(+)